MQTYLEVRSQRSRGTWPKCGPDKYVAIQIVPDNVEPLKVLNHKVAEKRGIQIIYCGEGYSKNTGKQSMFGKALQKANEIIAKSKIITKEIATTAHYRQEFHHISLKNADGTPIRCRVNGACKTWKTRPSEFRLPVKHGLRDCFYITEQNAKDWQTV